MVEASPSADDVKRELGCDVTYNADGSWEAVVRDDRAKMAKALDMLGGVRRVDTERGERVHAMTAHEAVVEPSGRVSHVPAHLVDRVKDGRGLRPKINWGRPSSRWVARGGELVKVF